MTQNRLAGETSPYLLQHKDNPVAWRPWGHEALAEARAANKPILLSVGYAACHWCHVMAHESFEDAATARLMNDLFVNIKVDREERPDIDALYMTALHQLGEQGGWPLTMFLTPDAEPFWGGTYFPPEPRFGRPSFTDVLTQIAQVFRDDPERVRHNADLLTERLKPVPSETAGIPSEAAIEQVARRMLQAVDPKHGGLRGTPKFPQPSVFNLLWRAGLRFGIAGALEATELTLTQICQGGIYDHLGGGFARYSVDERWLAPHFEKMLYDNALLIDLMAEAWREHRNPLFRTRIEETVAWLLREMVAEGGGFAASLDADSEGQEGKFYLWSAAEIEAVLGAEDAAFFGRIYDVTPTGNWEGHTILNRLATPEPLPPEDEVRLAPLKAKLLARRATRVRPGWDDKVLADWNGLMIAALADAADLFDRPDWLAAARRAYDFVSDTMVRDGRLGHAWRQGRASAPGIASDYANMIAAALRLASITGEPRFLADARAWTATLEAHHAAPGGGYHLAADDTTDVIVRTLAATDDAVPNPNAVMLGNLVGLYLWTGEDRYLAQAEAVLGRFAGDIGQLVFSHLGLLTGALDLHAPKHVVIVAPGSVDRSELRAALTRISLPGAVVQWVSDPAEIAAGTPAAGKTARQARATAYVCVGPQCSSPVTEGEALMEALRTARRAGTVTAAA